MFASDYNGLLSNLSHASSKRPSLFETLLQTIHTKPSLSPSLSYARGLHLTNIYYGSTFRLAPRYREFHGSKPVFCVGMLYRKSQYSTPPNKSLLVRLIGWMDSLILVPGILATIAQKLTESWAAIAIFVIFYFATSRQKSPKCSRSSLKICCSSSCS
eukprot:scaffold1605_cov158-Amphora_coffeaeformis.AAC.13